MKSEGPARPGAATEGTFPEFLAAAIAERGVSLEWLRARLADRGRPVSLATLSYWRAGRRQPERSASMDALTEIESLLGLARGELAQRLGPPRRSGARGTDATLARLLPDRGGDVLAALARLGLARADELLETALHVAVDVDADGSLRSVSRRAVLRAHRDGALRAPVVHLSEDALPGPPTLRMTGAAVGADASRPEDGVVTCEAVLDRPLLAGEETMVEARIELDGCDDTSYRQLVVRRLPELLVWVRFDRARLPRSVEVWSGSGGAEEVRGVDLDGASTVHQRWRRFGPGIAGVRWTW